MPSSRAINAKSPAATAMAGASSGSQCAMHSPLSAHGASCAASRLNAYTVSPEESTSAAPPASSISRTSIPARRTIPAAGRHATACHAARSPSAAPMAASPLKRNSGAPRYTHCRVPSEREFSDQSPIGIAPVGASAGSIWVRHSRHRSRRRHSRRANTGSCLSRRRTPLPPGARAGPCIRVRTCNVIPGRAIGTGRVHRPRPMRQPMEARRSHQRRAARANPQRRA